MISKKWIVVFSSVIILTLCAVGFTVAQPDEPIKPPMEPPRIINVNGTGIIKVKPDMSIINLGVVTEANEAKESQNQNSRISNSIVEALKKLEIKEEDIQTTEYSVNPIYKYEEGRQPVISGYQTVQMFSVRVYDLSKTGVVIDSATSAGANRINGISFDVKEKNTLKLQAIEIAVKDARIKADTALKAASESVLKLISMNVNEGFQNSPTPVLRGAKDAGVAENVQIMAGQMELTVTVNATFSF